MAFGLFDRVKFTSTTLGTADFGIGATSASFQSLVSAGMSDGDTSHFVAFTSSQFELFLGTLNAGVLERTTVIDGSDGPATLVDFTFLPTVAATALAQDFTGGGGSGVDVEDGGTPVATATTLNFTGAGVVATDSGGGVVEVAVSGGGGGLTSETITSGASPVAADPTVDITYIISGGTGGDEIVTIADLEPYGVASEALFGKQHVFILKTKTGGSDRVLIQKPFGGGGFDIYDLTGTNIATTTADGFPLGYVPATAVLRWIGYDWYGDNTAFDNGAQYSTLLTYVPSSPGSNQHVLTSNTGGTGVWNSLGGSIEYAVTGGAPTAATPYFDQYYVSTGGTAGTEVLTFAAPIVDQIGRKVMIRLGSRTNVADVLSVDVTNIRDAAGGALTSIEGNVNDEYVVLVAYSASEWRVASDVAQTMTII